MPTKKLEQLIGKFCSLQLVIPRAVGHFYHLQMDLKADNHASQATAYLSGKNHRDIKCWKYLCAGMSSRATYIAEIVERLATDVGYTDVSGIG